MLAIQSYTRRAEDAGDLHPEAEGPAVAVAAWAVPMAESAVDHGPGAFVLVDVQITSNGRRALYEFDTRNGSMSLAAD